MTTSILRFTLATTFVFAACINVRGGIINGDFGTGDFTGWTLSAIDDFGDPLDPNDFITVEAAGSGNAAVFDTRQFADGLFIATLEQTFAVTADEPILRFDFSLPSLINDPTGTGTGIFPDALFASVEAGGDFFELLAVDDFGPLADPFGTAPGTVALGVASDPFFELSLAADLTSLAGGDVTLFIDLVQEDDGFQSVFDPTNFALTSETKGVIPEPVSLIVWSLLGIIGAIGHRRQQRCRRRGAKAFSEVRKG
jgi:hypothetical protein